MSTEPVPSRLGRWVPQITVFVSSACIMVVELVAGRIVSRHLGSSLYTWTSVIGVVLAGIAVGNYVGGRLADRYRAFPTLSTLFVAASITCVAITVLNHQVGEWVLLWGFPWPLRVGTHVAIVFLVPSLILGMISPVAAKMALDQGRETGRTIGSVYAWGVVGSIVGTFATGFYLIALFGTATVIWGVAGTLAVAGVFFGVHSWRSWGWGIVVAFLTVLGAGPWAWARTLGEQLRLRETRDPNVIYVDESQYSHIRVSQGSEDPRMRNMLLDKLLHSTIILNEPRNLQYGYERVYAAVTRALAGDRDSLNTLTIGGGGYVFPRYVEEVWPRSRTEVVEIDPAVTAAAVAAFGLPADHRLIVRHEDGRAFVRRTLEARRVGVRVAPYDFLYLDVFNDYSVPYQLTTVEFLRQIDELLAPDGVFLMNMIDELAEGRFLASMIRTMDEVFAQVSVFAEGSSVSREPKARNTFILAGTKHPVDYAEAVAGYEHRTGLYQLSARDMREVRAVPGSGVLTDDWAPIENFLAPVVKSSALQIAAQVLRDRAREHLRRGETEDALRVGRRALGFHAGSDQVHAVLAETYLAEQKLDEAIAHYTESLRLRPAQLELKVNLASALAQRGRLEEAERQLRDVLRVEPVNSSALSNLGIVLMQQGRFGEAITSCRRAVQVKPRSVKGRINLGVALFRAERFDEAEEEFAAVLELDPTNETARQNLQRVRRVSASSAKESRIAD